MLNQQKEKQSFDQSILFNQLVNAVEERFSKKEVATFSEDYKIDKYPRLKEAMESIAPAVLFNGPWGSGKTRLLAEKAYWLCRKFPNYKAALVRKELKHLRRTLWKFLVDKTIPRSILDESYYNKTDLEIKFSNGSEIYGCGMDDPHKLASTEFGFIAVEEAIEIIKDDDFNWIEGRARDPGCSFHQVMYACNAGPPAHHLYKKFFIEKPRDEKGNPMTHLVQSEVLLDILPQSYKARLDMLKGKFRDRFVLNKWIGYEGLVYDTFNPAEHIRPRFQIPGNWRYIMGIDFGFNNPFICLFWAVSPDNVWYLDREIYHSHRTVNQHAPQIKNIMEELNLVRGPLNKKTIVKKNGEEKEEVVLRQFDIYSDHDSEDQATLEEFGIITRNADKNVSSGIQAVYEMMSNNQIIFFEDCLVEKDYILEAQGRPTCTFEELQGYVWMNNQKDQPKKENDHGMDATRYAIFSDQNKTMPGFFIAGRRDQQPESRVHSIGDYPMNRHLKWLRGE